MCLYNGYSVPLAGFTVIIYFVPYTLVPLVGLLVRNINIGVLCSCTDLERTTSCIASAGHAWAVPVSDMRGALRALYEVTIMPIFIASCLHINVFLSY